MSQPKAITGITDPSKARLVYWGGTEYQHAPADNVGYQPLDADLTTIAGLSPAAGAVMIGNGSAWTADTTPTLTGLLTTNGQIAFPTTQNPSADPNTLDDYEEGTFTPTIIGGTSAGVGTYTRQTGNYTKIGNRVFFNIQISWTAHTGTGATLVVGLPFSSFNMEQPVHIVPESTLSYVNTLYARINATTSSVLLLSVASGSVATVAIDATGGLQAGGMYLIQ